MVGRQAAGVELRRQQLLAQAMDADAAECVGDRGQRADHVDRAGAAHLVQRPGAVLAARPGDQRPGTAAHGCRRCRRAGAAGSGFAASTMSGRPAMRRMTVLAARSPDSQAPRDRAPHGFVHRLAGEVDAAAHRLHQGLARPLPAGRGGRRSRRAPTARRSSCVTCVRRKVRFDVGAEHGAQPFDGELDHQPFRPSPPARGRTGRRPSTTDNGVPDTLASSAAVRGPDDFSNTRSSRCKPSGLPGNSSAIWSRLPSLSFSTASSLALGQAAFELDAARPPTRWSTP